MKEWKENKFIELPKNHKVWTGRGWSYQRMNKILHRLKKIGYFKQIGRFEFIRTEMTKEEGFVILEKRRLRKILRKRKNLLKKAIS